MKTLFENATYLDNIYSISAFAVCLNALASSSKLIPWLGESILYIFLGNNIIFCFVLQTKGDIPVSISYGILDLMVAFLVGVIMGSLTACFPHKKDV